MTEDDIGLLILLLNSELDNPSSEYYSYISEGLYYALNDLISSSNAIESVFFNIAMFTIPLEEEWDLKEIKGVSYIVTSISFQPSFAGQLVDKVVNYFSDRNVTKDVIEDLVVEVLDENAEGISVEYDNIISNSIDLLQSKYSKYFDVEVIDGYHTLIGFKLTPYVVRSFLDIKPEKERIRILFNLFSNNENIKQEFFDYIIHYSNTFLSNYNFSTEQVVVESSFHFFSEEDLDSSKIDYTQFLRCTDEFVEVMQNFEFDIKEIKGLTEKPPNILVQFVIDRVETILNQKE